jgi:hypothetical protein
MERVAQRLADQSGVISRRQLLAAGYAPHDIKRLLRRNQLASIAIGVYVSHTGEPRWIEHAWAALLAVSGQVEPTDVALAHWSALRIAEGPGRRDPHDRPIHVAIPSERRVRPAGDVVVDRGRYFEERLQPGRCPPRIRYEEAVLDVAVSLPQLDAVGVLARAVGSRRSTARRILEASQARGKLHERRWLEAVLTDIDEGTHSVLEHAFTRRVVLPHGLPRPNRQQREVTAIGVAYRDAAFGDVLVELDGRLHLEQRDADLDRDLFALATGRRTARLGWGQVLGRPCQTAAALANIFTVGRPCSASCPVGRLVESAVYPTDRGFHQPVHLSRVARRSGERTP